MIKEYVIFEEINFFCEILIEIHSLCSLLCSAVRCILIVSLISEIAGLMVHNLPENATRIILYSELPFVAYMMLISISPHL